MPVQQHRMRCKLEKEVASKRPEILRITERNLWYIFQRCTQKVFTKIIFHINIKKIKIKFVNSFITNLSNKNGN